MRTDAEGYYSFGSLPQGVYSLFPMSFYYRFDPFYKIIQMPQTEIQAHDFTATAREFKWRK